MNAFKSSELTLNKEGKLYHLNIGPDDVAETVILVGDQSRVETVAAFFDTIRFKTQHREFATITGSYKNQEITVMSHGIGCDNMDIVLTELDAAVNIDLEKREIRPDLKSLNLVRIGTCGALHSDIEVGSAIVSNYALGMDGVANFYDLTIDQEIRNGLDAFKSQTNWPDDLVIPYFAKANQELVDVLADCGEKGITVTANGFYGPQGRGIRLPLKSYDFKENIRQFNWNNCRVTNLEMETSALLSLAEGLGHKATTICLVLANRYNNTFESDFDSKMKTLIQNVLDRVLTLN